jgi:hypothetical protein
MGNAPVAAGGGTGKLRRHSHLRIFCVKQQLALGDPLDLCNYKWAGEMAWSNDGKRSRKRRFSSKSPPQNIEISPVKHSMQ